MQTPAVRAEAMVADVSLGEQSGGGVFAKPTKLLVGAGVFAVLVVGAMVRKMHKKRGAKAGHVGDTILTPLVSSLVAQEVLV